MDPLLATYVAESRELLQDMETLLLGFARGQGTAEDVHAVFRAAHTIKGSAGLFGLDPIIEFMHGVETVLDEVRERGEVVAPELATVLLECQDHVSLMVEALEGDGLDRLDLSAGASLRSRLEAVAGTRVVTPSAPPPADTGTSVAPATMREWSVSLRFGPEVFRNGMDPLSFLRYLETVAEILTVEASLHGVPAADEFDPESCHLGFDLRIATTVSQAEIEDVFAFVRQDCEVRVVSGGIPASSVVEALVARSDVGSDEPLGEILAQAGAVSREELQRGLDAQRAHQEAVAEGAPPRLGQILVEQGAVDPALVQVAMEKQKNARDTKGGEARFIRVDADKLDRLINRIGELVIASAGIGIAARRAGEATMTEAASTLADLVEDVRDGAMQLRMVPIGATFNRFQRVVHDVARDLGKDIGLVVTGGDTELDKTMVERITDPLTHLIRNAMDHGIETPEARLDAGKPARGTVHLNAFHDSGSIVIEVSDDGAGLHRDRIVAHATRRGLIESDRGMTDTEVWNLIFAPGFSTAAKVSNLSGRGVGMDVVKRNIQELRGSVEIDTRAGAGTTIRLRLPLTLAIIDGFLVAVGDATFVVPLDIVEECVELTDTARTETHGRHFINLRDRVLPFIALRDHFGIDGPRARRQNILVVRQGDERVGLVVDELMGEAQTVIKPLGRLFRTVKGIGGSTVLGDGRVALILDVPTLLEHVRAGSASGQRWTAAA